MAFENYALYPTLAVKDNIAFPLKIRRWPRSRIDEKVAWVAKAVQIADILHRRPFELLVDYREGLIKAMVDMG